MTRHKVCEVPGGCEVCDSSRLNLIFYAYTDEDDRILPECAKCGEPLNLSYIDKEGLV